MDGRVIYLHPLAYLLGLEGIALLRVFSGVYDRDFLETSDGDEVRPIATRKGYDL
jgi:hypothetical protein